MVQRMNIEGAPVPKRYHEWNTTVDTDGFDQLNDATAVGDPDDYDRAGSVQTYKPDKIGNYAGFGYFVRCNKASSVYCYVSNTAAASYATRHSYSLAANTPTSYEFTGEGEYWYVKVVPASTANNTFISTYKVNI